MNTYNEHSACVVMSINDQQSAFDEFNKLFSGEIPKFQNALRTRMEALLSCQSLELVRFGVNAIALGLHKILNNSCSEICCKNADLAYFFIKYFVSSLSEADVGAAIELRGRLKSAMTIESAFSALFLELAMAQSYKSKGHSVDFIPLSKEKNVRTPDIVVKTAINRLSVECKAIALSAKSPIPTGKFDEIGNVFCGLLERLGRAEKKYVLSVLYIGLKNEDDNSRLADAIECADSASHTTTNVKSKYWWIELSVAPADIIRNDKGELGKGGDIYPPQVRGYKLVEVDDAGYVTFDSMHPYRFDDAIRHGIKDAIDQLPEDGMRLVCLQVNGSLFTRPGTAHFSRYAELVQNNNDSMRMINREKSLNNGFVGVQIISDFMITQLDDHLRELQYYCIFVFGKENMFTDTYLLDFRNMLPSQIENCRL